MVRDDVKLLVFDALLQYLSQFHGVDSLGICLMLEIDSPFINTVSCVGEMLRTLVRCFGDIRSYSVRAQNRYADAVRFQGLAIALHEIINGGL